MEHLSLRDKAYVIIRDKLLNNEFEPGSRIREDRIAEEISMSRTPVREAFNQLAAEGLIDNVSRKGLFSKVLNKKQISDLLDIRLTLESLAIEKCIEKITSEELANLEQILQGFIEATLCDDFKMRIEMDSRFHKEIVRISGNAKLIEYISDISDLMRAARVIEQRALSSEVKELYIHQHRDILEGIRSGDKMRAQLAIQTNISGIRGKLGIVQPLQKSAIAFLNKSLLPSML